MNELQCLKVAHLEDVMLDMDQSYCPVTHTFSNGVYVREVFMPKDSLIVGHFHKTPHLNIMISGVLEIIDGDDKTILEAPMMFTGKEGRKVARIIEDCVWLNVYGTDEQDIDKLEAMFMIKSPVFIDRVVTNNYLEVIQEYGFDESMVRSISEVDDLVPLPYGSYKFKVGDSSIEGRGIISTGNIEMNEFIGMCRIGDNRTSLGRYLNHSPNPNTKMIVVGDCIGLIALDGIYGCSGGMEGVELTVDYSDVLSEIQQLKLNQNQT